MHITVEGSFVAVGGSDEEGRATRMAARALAQGATPTRAIALIVARGLVTLEQGTAVVKALTAQRAHVEAVTGRPADRYVVEEVEATAGEQIHVRVSWLPSAQNPPRRTKRRAAADDLLEKAYTAGRAYALMRMATSDYFARRWGVYENLDVYRGDDMAFAFWDAVGPGPHSASAVDWLADAFVRGVYLGISGAEPGSLFDPEVWTKTPRGTWLGGQR